MTMHSQDDLEPRSGIPKRGQLGESKKELWALLAAGVVIAIIIIAFWLESRP